MTSLILFVACFMFVVVLLLLGVVYSHIHWLLKALLMIVSLAFSGFFYRGYIDSLGYATPMQPPSVFQFLYGVVREPALIHDDPGAIYLWIMQGNVPRAIVIPYTVQNRKIVADANRHVEADEPVFLGKDNDKKSTPYGHGDKSSDGSADKSGGTNNVPYHLQGTMTLLFKAPPDTTPKKEVAK